MKVQAALVVFDGLVTLVEVVAKEIQALAKGGEITQEDQMAVKKRADALRSSTAFEGPEWEVTTDTTQPPTS